MYVIKLTHANTSAQTFGKIAKSVFRIHGKGKECTWKDAKAYVANVLSCQEASKSMYALVRSKQRHRLAYAIVEQESSRGGPCYYLAYMDNFKAGNGHGGMLLSRLTGMLARSTEPKKGAPRCTQGGICKGQVYLKTNKRLKTYYFKRGFRLLSTDGKSFVFCTP